MLVWFGTVRPVASFRVACRRAASSGGNRSHQTPEKQAEYFSAFVDKQDQKRGKKLNS